MKQSHLQDNFQNTPARPFVVEGTVAHGDKRGRLLGFPTANIVGDGVALDDGVWAGTLEILSMPHRSVHVAAISLGRRPTYYSGESERLIEAFLLDFDQQIYDEVVRVCFHHWLRPQKPFINSAQLVKQLHSDVANVRTWALRRGLFPAPEIQH
jgi:FAD synthase